ncbi:MAG: glycosyltransferase, partial [Candidatus Daviesbacteria bacterium]|nr:glycosyltransferase [Candidatus Daviesbacteria bacterium]
KGLKTVFEIVNRLGREVRLFPLRKDEYAHWLNKLISEQKDLISSKKVSLEFDKDREDLVANYQTSKLFLFPIQWEEPFGLVLLESLSCGTPIVAFARGSVPEVIKDGETGFIINPTDNDIRGDWIVKKTGIEGLCEAIEKIYSMPEGEYQKMRLNCRVLAEKSFSAGKMAQEYLKIYNKIVKI